MEERDRARRIAAEECKEYRLAEERRMEEIADTKKVEHNNIIQCTLLNAYSGISDTLQTQHFVLCREVVLFRMLLCSRKGYFWFVLY